MPSCLHGTLGLHLELLGGGLTFLLRASFLYVVQASIKLDEVCVHLIEVVADVGREDCHHLLHLRHRSGGGHWIDLVSEYQVSQSLLKGLVEGRLGQGRRRLGARRRRQRPRRAAARRVVASARAEGSSVGAGRGATVA